MGFLPWEIRVAFSGGSQQQQCRATQPTVHAWCFNVCITHRPLTWTTGSLTRTQMFMHTGCTNTVRESALKVVSGGKIPCRTEESNLCQWRAGPTLYQLSYIPIPFVCYSLYILTSWPLLCLLVTVNVVIIIIITKYLLSANP